MTVGMRDFTKLKSWQRAHKLLVAIEVAAARYPEHERYDLTRQTTRAARSISSNISEGAGRRTGPDYARFIRMSASSCNEVENHLLVARDLGYLPEATWAALRSEVGQIRAMLTRLAQVLEARPPGGERSRGPS